MTSISLSRKHNILLKPNSQEIDFGRVNAHLGRLRTKYQGNLATFKAVSGQQHPWYKSTPTTKETFLSRILHSLRGGKKGSSTGKQTGTNGSTSANGGTGNVPLVDESEELWHGPITLGGQTIQVDFDTGSSDIILNQGSYKPSAQATKTGKTFQTGYGDGTTAKGQIYLDSLEIGGLKANGAAIGLANNKFLNAQEQDSGIAGMAFPALAQLKQDPFFDVLLKANVLKEPVFTFTLRQNQPSLFLGGIPTGLAEPVYVDVDSSQGFWGTQGSVNGNQTNGIQDTGTTLIVAPNSFAQTLFKSLNLQTFTQDGSTYATYDASNPPKITLQFGSFSQDLSSETLSFGQTNDGKPVLSIIGSDVGIDSVIFGDSFLRNVTIVFSRAEKPQIGFIPQSQQ